VEGTLLWGLYSVMVLVSFTLGVLTVPSLTGSLFSGQIVSSLVRNQRF